MPDLSTKNNINQRVYWGNRQGTAWRFDLTRLQRESYEWFLKEGISYLLQSVNPILDFTGKNWRLEFGDYTLGTPKLSPDQAVVKGISYDAPLRVKVTLVNLQTNEEYQQEVFLGDIPLMTQKGTFIINGIERAVVNQIVRSPGVFFSSSQDPITGRILYGAELRPAHGSWLEFSVSRTDVVTVKIDRRRKFAATTFLRAIGYADNDQLAKLFEGVDNDPDHHYLESTLAKDLTKDQDEALLEIFRKMRPGDPVVLENARNILQGMFFNNRRYDLTRVGRFKLNKKLKLEVENTPENWVLKNEDIVATIRYLIGLQNGQGKVDDIDHLANRRVRRVGELVAQNAFWVGLLRLERVVKERMSLLSVDTEINPGSLVNARPIIAAVNEFFRSSQLSQILDQTNPLSEVDHLRRLTVTGQGGITRERATFSIRDINHSQYGRIDPIRSPEGQNIGLVTYLALYSQINDYGFLETPYKKVIQKDGHSIVTDEIVYLSADDEEDYYITEAMVATDKDGRISQKRVPLRYNGSFFEGDTKLVNFIDVSPQQIVGVSASLIPFLAHDDANRALMGSHMQNQAVPLLLPSAPIVGTGMEGMVAENMGRIVKAPFDGEVTYVDAEKITLTGKKEKQTFEIRKFVNTPESTCYSQRPVVSLGHKVKEGELLIDGTSTQGGELALGQNLLIAYMNYEGLGYEDAIVISDKLVKQDLLTSIHIEEYVTDVVETKLGPDELTRDIPNVAEENLMNLDEKGIVRIGATVGPNDILVGKVQPKGETELTAEERLLRAIFGEKAKEVRDTSLRMPHGERGTVIGIQILSRENGDELDAGTLMRIKVKVAQLRKVTEGDKLAGRHGNKGVISKIVPEVDMPHLEDGTAVDIIISPVTILSRMNLGQLLEVHFGIAAKKLGFKVAVPVFEKVPENVLSDLFKEANLPDNGKFRLIDGRTGEYFEKPVVVGITHFLKLIHMVEDKQHARSTGPYSMVTQQPLGGKAQMGGQRLGELEVWALEAYGAAHILQEMLTIKSDDVVGRTKAYQSIIEGTEIPQALIPESFKVLVKELQSLGTDMSTIDQKVVEVEETENLEENNKVAEFEEAMGVTQQASPEELGDNSPMEIVDLKEEALENAEAEEKLEETEMQDEDHVLAKAA
ncbi:DNA-directed RNA polymerase subunit beta [Patescibacteria group bacterium]|nr:DNA-directed RNA polymerase subunit beta [Patescibacteria group bacterium]